MEEYSLEVSADVSSSELPADADPLSCFCVYLRGPESLPASLLLVLLVSGSGWERWRWWQWPPALGLVGWRFCQLGSDSLAAPADSEALGSHLSLLLDRSTAVRGESLKSADWMIGDVGVGAQSHDCVVKSPNRWVMTAFSKTVV